MDAELPFSDAHRDDFIVSGAVPNTVEDVQVLHHDVAVQSHVEYLPARRKERASKPSASRPFGSWTTHTCLGFKFKNNLTDNRAGYTPG